MNRSYVTIIIVITFLFANSPGHRLARAAEDSSENYLKWTTIRSLLRSQKVASLQNLCDSVLKLDVEKQNKDSFRQKKTIDRSVCSMSRHFEDFSSLDKNRGKTKQEVQETLVSSIEFKPKRSFKDATKVFTVPTHQRNKALQLLTFEKLVYADIYLDDEDQIIGWRFIGIEGRSH